MDVPDISALARVVDAPPGQNAARLFRFPHCSAAANSLDGPAIRSLNRFRKRPPASGLKLGFAYVGPVIAALYWPVMGAVLQLSGTGAVRLSVFLLVPARMGADQLLADLAGLSQASARRSSVNLAGCWKAVLWPIRLTGLLSRSSSFSLSLSP